MNEKEKFEHSQAILADIGNIVKRVEIYVCGMLRRDHDEKVDNIIFDDKNDAHKEILLKSLANQLVSCVDTGKLFSELILKQLKDFMKDYKDALAIEDFTYENDSPNLQERPIDSDVEAITLAITKKVQERKT